MNYIDGLLDFINQNPSTFHVIEAMQQQLQSKGFTPLYENQKWDIQPGKNYYVSRNGSSLIAFQVPGQDFAGFHIVASHSDSPTFKVKENAEIIVNNEYTTLNTERYGGMILSTWLDRPLSVAGRVVVKENNTYTQKLVNINQDLLIIPSVAIHMDRTANDGKKFNPQSDMLPLLGSILCKDNFAQLIAQAAQVDKEDIIASDLFLYNRQKGCVLGAKEEYVCSARLDDLQCVYGSLQGFLNAQATGNMPVLAVFDNEEVGSGTKQGAASTFLFDVLTRVNTALGKSGEDYLISLANSFMISADNAHAVHPNSPSLADPTHKPYMNKGIVIKHNANQKYTTDAISNGILKGMLQDLSLPYQSFANRSDMMGGSTLGNISNTQVALNTVDIGLPQLAMHSAYETAGAQDTLDFIKLCQAFYSSAICFENGQYRIK